MGVGTYNFAPNSADAHNLASFSGTGRLNITSEGPITLSERQQRPGQPACQYYLRTGTCKFGETCKFHHPQETAGVVGRVSLNVLGYPLRPNEPECVYYQRTGQCKFGNSCKFHHPQPSDMMVTGSKPGSQNETANELLSGTYPSYGTGSIPIPAASYYGLPRENLFPERPGQPDCQFYIKTGDCKFGAVCRFHHPREKVIPMPDYVLTPIGLPLRPGEPVCIFYSRYGICKFGQSCNFDHPMEVGTYNFAPNLASFSGTGPLNITSEGPITLSERQQMPSSDNNIDPED